jgi:hypothetical protein
LEAATIKLFLIHGSPNGFSAAELSKLILAVLVEQRQLLETAHQMA